MFSVKLFICVLHLICCSAETNKTIYVELNAQATNEEVAFLKKYGYIPEGQKGAEYAYSEQAISDALRKMQAFAGLPESGSLDAETKKLFTKKRCGVKDIVSTSTSARNRRYILQQAWNKRSISYRVVNGSNTLQKSHVEKLMALGLSVWAPHGNLRFHQQDEGRADIQISFVVGDHGDGFPFDGPGRVVAHAFPPPHGAMHFDDDELWGDNPDEEEEDVTDFFAVAIHEIGHALGLSHSTVKASVMYPYYQVPVERLHSDDILGMQELYMNEQFPEEPVEAIESLESAEGTQSPVSHSSLVPRFTRPGPDSGELDENENENLTPDLCMANYDTLQVLHGQIYVFEEEWVWILSNRNVVGDRYPQRFHEVFIGLPSDVTNIKAIYERHNGNVVIFKDRDYWEFDPSFRLMKLGNISEYLIPETVSELSTVFISNYNNKTYLIEEERYWRFDETTWTMDQGYPKEMSAWRQVPYPVNAAIIWREDTYFFQGPRFWRFDNTLVQAHAYYPLPTAQIWFACEPSPDMGRYNTNDGP